MKQIALKSYGVSNIGYYLIVYNSNIGHDIGYYSGVPCFILVIFPWITEHLINKQAQESLAAAMSLSDISSIVTS